MGETNEVAIEAEDLTKSYATSERGMGRMQFLQPGSSRERHQALKGVSLRVGRGETFGIMGRNGAGKSTLLKVLAGITEPDSGTVQVNGEVLAVIGPMAGMKPDLTGRENIQVRAAALGMGKDVLEDRIDEIIEFADLGDYIDRPFRMYSAGMKARLGFAVTFAFEPDIMLVDETLAGGDEAFKRKVLARVAEIQRKGATIVLVSHGAGMIIKFCDRAMLLERGEKLMTGSPKSVTDAYQKLLLAGGEDYEQTLQEIRSTSVDEDKSDADTKVSTAPPPNGKRTQASSWTEADRRYELVGLSVPSTRWQGPAVGGSVESVEVDPSPDHGADTNSDYRRYCCRVAVKVDEPVRQLNGRALIKTAEGLDTAVVRLSRKDGAEEHESMGQGRYELVGHFLNRLSPGRYTLDVAITGWIGDDRVDLNYVKDALEFASIGEAETEGTGLVDLTVPDPRETPAPTS